MLIRAGPLPKSSRRWSMPSSNDRVGPGRPPKHSRFKKGQSGNPKGRPKGTLNLATVLERTLRESVVINENGERKTITKLEAAVKQLVNKAAKGETTAFKILSALADSAEERMAESCENSIDELNQADHLVMENIVKRLAKTESSEGRK